MMITVVDYGIGNILSVTRALNHCGAEVLVTNLTNEIISARALILPGVGAFEDGMRGLRKYGLIEPIKDYASRGFPFLGICLGMQMMLDESEEFGIHQGLGLIPGKVIRINDITIKGEVQKIPHIGWNKLRLPNEREKSWWEKTILANIGEKAEVYFVHSYTAVPDHDEHRLADVYYGGRMISAVIRKENIYGCQFHPEKSGEVGLSIIKNFLEICKDYT
jgi:glutamine amidotransferase